MKIADNTAEIPNEEAARKLGLPPGQTILAANHDGANLILRLGTSEPIIEPIEESDG